MNAGLNIQYTKPQTEIFFNIKAKYNLYPKGRRFGFTQGGIQAVIEYALDGISPILWGDTINGNIDRYVERYALPILKQLPGEYWRWNIQKRELKILDRVIDFRSADRPENWEGFGYKIVILNEAGIILKDSYLYKNTVLPMLVDFPDSKLIAGGTPKGKHLKHGGKHLFYELSERAQDDPAYYCKSYTSYDNPLIDREDIKQLEHTLDKDTAQQEIYGQFVEFSDGIPFAYNFDEAKHVSDEAVYNPEQTLRIILDFNLQPFCCIFRHQWNDSQGEHVHTIGELQVDKGSIPEMCERIRSMFPRHMETKNILITGDAMGKRGDISQRDNASLYLQIQRELGIASKQLILPHNPRVEYSRSLTNFLLHNHKDYKVHPDCKGVIRDMKFVQVDAYGDIMKRNRRDVIQQADFLDCMRYADNTWLYHYLK